MPDPGICTGFKRLQAFRDYLALTKVQNRLLYEDTFFIPSQRNSIRCIYIYIQICIYKQMFLYKAGESNRLHREK